MNDNVHTMERAMEVLDLNGRKGIVVGIALGIGLMHLRFEPEINNFDRVATYAFACNYSLRALGLLKEDVR